MDFFEKITGFKETNYFETQERLQKICRNGAFHNTKTGVATSYSPISLVGVKEIAEAIHKGNARPLTEGRGSYEVIYGDVSEFHRDPNLSHANFQAASQFNMLEMVGPRVTPHDGVTGYIYDRTQGPACAISCGSSLIYRNYLQNVGGNHIGQHPDHQIDSMSDVHEAFKRQMNVDHDIWHMVNGYLLINEEYLRHIHDAFVSDEIAMNMLVRDNLKVGFVKNALVGHGEGENVVSQTYCSALPISYNHIRNLDLWEPFARSILEASYELTLYCTNIFNSNDTTILTRLGGGAFGNPDSWIDESMNEAIRRQSNLNHDIKLVKYR